MRIVINKKGELFVERSNKFAKQFCPFVTTGYEPCGDWCPHFSEPNTEVGTGVQDIDLCHGTRLVGQIEDQRKEGDPT